MPGRKDPYLVYKFNEMYSEGSSGDKIMVHFEWFILNQRVIFAYLTENSYCLTFLFNVEREIPSILADFV